MSSFPTADSPPPTSPGSPPLDHNDATNTSTVMQYSGGISQDGKFHGIGTIVYGGGTSYQGEWQYGQRHGTGEYKYEDGGNY